jgi:alpha-amylase
MGVALIAWGRFFRDGEKVTVPAPNTDPGKPWLWDFIAKEAPALRRVGFTAIQTPPASMALGGAGRGCDGYGVFDLRDLGSKPEQGSTPLATAPLTHCAGWSPVFMPLDWMSTSTSFSIN